MDQAVVVWRDSIGQVHAKKDLCVHIGTALSSGWVKNDCLVCPYHSWEYNKKGDCVLIPQARNTPIPKKAETPVYFCQERYGIIWVALKAPVYPLPEIKQFDQKNWKFVETGPFEWQSDAYRQLENFTDFGHFTWVHPGLLGDPDRPEVPECKVETKGHVLHYAIVRPESTNSEEFPIFGNEEKQNPSRQSQYELHLPYTISLRIGW